MKKKINKNSKTENTLIGQKKRFNLNGGISECIKFENKNFLSHASIKNKDIIEFGCGIFPALFGIDKFNMPNKYIASDTSKKIINAAKKNENRPIYKIFDLEKKIKLKNKYDIIILKGVLHHTKKPEIIIKKIKNYLKKDGIIIISEPNLSSLIGNLLKFLLSFFFKISMEDSPYGQYNFKKINKSIKIFKMKIVKKWYSVLLLIPLTGDYGRIKVFPDIKFLFEVFIIIEKIIYNLLNLLLLTKFTHFKINLIIKKN